MNAFARLLLLPIVYPVTYMILWFMRRGHSGIVVRKFDAYTIFWFQPYSDSSKEENRKYRKGIDEFFKLNPKATDGSPAWFKCYGGYAVPNQFAKAFDDALHNEMGHLITRLVKIGNRQVALIEANF